MRGRLQLLLLFLVLAAGSAHADRTVTATRIDDADITTIDLGVPIRIDGIMGNANTPAWAITNWIYGAEGYKYLYFPPLFSDVGCEFGYQVDKVHMIMQFGLEDVPATFDVFVDLEDAVWDSQKQCWVPGIEDCISPVFTVQIDSMGLYDIAVPLYEWCECGFMEYYYFVGFHIPTMFETGKEPSAVCDSSPIGCTSYNDYGLGWNDVVNYHGWPGELVMWADVFCCTDPLPGKQQTWGEIKNLYR